MLSSEAANWVSGIGSLAAVIAALYGYWRIERHRRTDQLNVEKGIAYELVASVLNVGNHIKAIQQHCSTQRNDVTVRFSTGAIEKYKVLNPLIGLSSEGDLSIPVGSTELLMKTKNVELWNDLNLLFARNKSLTRLMIEYRPLWQSMIDATPKPSDYSGSVGHVSGASQEYMAVKPLLLIIDKVVEDITSQANDTARLGDKVFESLGPTFRGYFGEPFLHLKEATKS